MEPNVRRIRPGEGARLRAAHLSLLAEAPWRESLRRIAEARTAEAWNEQASERAASDRDATFLALDIKQLLMGAGRAPCPAVSAGGRDG
jgi:transcription elongation GreA/GreB family factor